MKSILLRDHYRDVSGWGESKRTHIRRLKDGMSARLCRMGPSFPASESVIGVTRAKVARDLEGRRGAPMCPTCKERFMETLKESNA